MRKSRVALAVASAFHLVLSWAMSAPAQAIDSVPIKERGVVTLTLGPPISLPTQSFTIIEGVGIDSLQHCQGWHLHPYPQRSDRDERS